MSESPATSQEKRTVRWAARLGSFAGISVYVHATFLLILVWVGWLAWQEEPTLASVTSGIVFVLGIFGCVVLHEFGHALTAKRFGIRTRDIILLPIGGVARLERMPDDPRQELLVALAGPAVNVVIALSVWAWLRVTGGLVPLDAESLNDAPFLVNLMLVNVALVVFNMIPAFPMDGGRVLRAVLALRMDYAKATRVAARLGQGIALVFAVLGLATNPFLMLIAAFVWIGAAQEAALVQVRSALADVPLTAAMMTDYRTLSPDDSLGRVAEYLLAGHQQDFPVTADGDMHGEVLGVLTRAALLQALSRDGQSQLTRDVMTRDFQVARAGESLQAVVERMQTNGARTVPVVDAGRLVGIINGENIGELVSIRAALSRRA